MNIWSETVLSTAVMAHGKTEKITASQKSSLFSSSSSLSSSSSSSSSSSTTMPSLSEMFFLA
jgi:hypothetical protein